MSYKTQEMTEKENFPWHQSLCIIKHQSKNLLMDDPVPLSNSLSKRPLFFSFNVVVLCSHSTPTDMINLVKSRPQKG